MRCRVLSLPSGTHRWSACSGRTSWRRSREPPLAAAATLSPHALVERARGTNKKTQQWSAVVAATPSETRGSGLHRKHSPTSVKVVHTKAVVDVAMTGVSNQHSSVKEATSLGRSTAIHYPSQGHAVHIQ
jgi:hypothetical protein